MHAQKRLDANLFQSLDNIVNSPEFCDTHFNVGLNPIFIQYTTKKQTSLYNLAIKKSYFFPLCIDATGCIAQNVKNNKRLFLYQIVAPKTESFSQFPVTQMLSSQHDGCNTIMHFTCANISSSEGEHNPDILNDH